MNTPSTSARRNDSRAKQIAVGVIATLILVPGAVGFAEKLVQFFHTLDSVDGGRFTLVPLLNYLLIALGFLLLLLWGIARGMFRDIEGPKYVMLERESALDRRDGVGPADRNGELAAGGAR